MDRWLQKEKINYPKEILYILWQLNIGSEYFKLNAFSTQRI